MRTHLCVDNLGLGLQVLYSATDCVDNILGRLTMILIGSDNGSHTLCVVFVFL